MTVTVQLDITDFQDNEPITPPKDSKLLPLSPLDLLPSGLLPHGSAVPADLSASPL